MPDVVDLKQDARRKRFTIAVLAGIMAIAALWLNVIDEELGNRYAAMQSGTVRMTAVLAVLWLALPETTKGPAIWIAFGVLIVGIVLLPRAGKIGIKVIAPALAILGALAYLRRFTSLLTGKKR